MRELVLRYGPGGSFWQERPDLPQRPIRDWQQRLREVYRLGAERRRMLRLQRIYWVTWGSSYGGDELFNYSGLVRYRDGTYDPRPSLGAYRASARRHQGCAKTSEGACD
jgi:hypothetical protein